MKRLAGSTIVVLVLLCMSSAWSARSAPVAEGAEDAFMAVMILWRDGKFDEMYERSRAASHKSLPRKVFVSRMQTAPLRIQCCWKTLQNVEVRGRSSKTVEISADLGFDVVGVTKRRRGHPALAVGSSVERHETFTMRWSEGEWRFDLPAVLRLVENR